MTPAPAEAARNSKSAMVHRLTLLLLVWPAVVLPAVWPDDFAGAKRSSRGPVAVTEPALWEEFGFQDGETAQYAAGALKFQAVSYRFLDSTGALGAFQWQRPEKARPSALGKLAVETETDVLLAHGNYLFLLKGRKPAVADINRVIQRAPNLEQAPLPVLSTYLPSGDLVPNSGRYAIGPVALAKFEPRIPPAVAAFHFGSEAQIGTYRSAGGESRLAIFSYPTPQIARVRLEEFRKLPGAVVKRSGPLIALVLAPPNADEAERLLAQVRYQAAITWSERVPTRRDNIGDLILNIFQLAGFVLLFAVVAGIALGGARVLLRRLGIRVDPDPVITLHLEGR